MSLVLTLAMVLSLMAGICVSVSAARYTLLQEASITGTAIPELAVGDTLPELSYSVPDGANYTVSAQWWMDSANAAAGTAVEEGHSYKLEISVLANEGCAFEHSNITLLINGAAQDFMPVEDRGESGFAECRFIKEYFFCESIDKAEVSYDIPQLGKPLGDAKIPDGVNYTVLTEWHNASTDEILSADTVVKKGESYEIYIRLFPVVGYEFIADMQFWVNGELNDRGVIGSGIIMYWSEAYNFSDPISAVSITYGEPELGKAFPQPALTGKNCTMDYCWWNYNYNKRT